MRNPGGYFFGADGAFAAAQEGVRAILSRQLRRRFGKLPAWALERLDQAPPDQLEDWAARIFEAVDLAGQLGGHAGDL